MIGNPIIGKELISVLRSRTALVLALVSVGALALLALSIWPEAGINPAGALYSRLFMTIIFCGQLIMLTLFTPPFSATSITQERESNTWDMLYYSRLRPDHILVGKLIGAVAFLLILVAFSLPIIATCFLLGGVAPREMLLAYLILTMAGTTFGLLGLVWSSLLKSSFTALLITYICLLLLCGGVHVPMLLLPEWRAGQSVMHAIRCLSPFTAVFAICRDAFRSMGSDASIMAVLRYFAYSGIMCGVMVLVLLIRIAMRPVPRVSARLGVVDKETALSERIFRRIFFVIDERRRRRSISLWANPVLSLDLRTRVAGISNLLRACFACLIFAIGLVIMVSGTYGATGPDVIRLIALSFQIGLIALIGPSLTIAAIAGEVETNTFDLLRMTPLRPWTIFFGRFAAAAMLSIMLVVASAPVFLAIIYIQHVEGPIEWNYLIALMAVTCSTIVFTLSAGFFFSSVCRTTARAASWAYGLTALVTVGSLLGLVLRERLSEQMARFILAFNPVVTTVGAVSVKQFAEFGRWQNNVLALGAVSLVLIVASIYQLHRVAGPTD